MELTGELNRLAGTTGLGTAAAANAMAGTTLLETVHALNVLAGTTIPLELNGVCKLLASQYGGDSALDAPGCLATITALSDPAAIDSLLLETGDDLLLEAGGLILLDRTFDLLLETGDDLLLETGFYLLLDS